MDIKKDYNCVEHNIRVFSKQIDLEADYQEALPAYCDDIFRVVKCIGRSYITSTDISYNEVKLFGKIEICLTYYNENSKLCYADFEEDFSKTIAVPELSDSAFVCADIYDKYTNYRVINQRRIDVHNSSVILMKVYDKVKCPQICSCENAKLRRESFKLADVISSNLSRIEFDEELTLPAGNEPINRIISYSAFASLNEVKIIKDKALIKAVVSVDVLYTADNADENIEKLQYSFNASKIIDSMGISEDDYAICNISVGSMFIKGKSSDGDKVNTVDIFGELSVKTVFIREAEQDYITDGYIPSAVSENSLSDYPVSLASGMVNENKLINASFALPDDVKKVIEISVSIADTGLKKGKLVSKIIMNALCVNENGEVIGFSSGDEFDIQVNDSNDDIASVNIVSYDYTVSKANTLDLRINTQISVYSINNRTIKILSDISAISKKESAPTMVLYFGKENESVWEIAKSFSSDIDMIMNENSLKSETLETNTVLIIPKA